MSPLPTLRQLQFYMALVRRQSFSKAAEDCFVSQSTLSSAIKEMEALLDQQLVDRSTRAFALTPAGEEVASRAAAILAALSEFSGSPLAKWARLSQTRGSAESTISLSRLYGTRLY